MRCHLLEYTKEHYSELEVELKKQLVVRRQSLAGYLETMEWTPASGSEITLLILCRMFNISILVLRSDFIWLSKNVALLKCDVVLVQNCDGHFLGTKRLGGQLVDIGEVPQYKVNKRKSPSIQTSTPKDRDITTSCVELQDADLSPIGEKDNLSKMQDSTFSLNETSESTQRLREEVKKFEETSILDETVKEVASDVNANRVYGKLNIRDIGKDTLSDFSPTVKAPRNSDVLTPNSTQPLNVMTNSIITDESESVPLGIADQDAEDSIHDQELSKGQQGEIYSSESFPVENVQKSSPSEMNLSTPIRQEDDSDYDVNAEKSEISEDRAERAIVKSEICDMNVKVE